MRLTPSIGPLEDAVPDIVAVRHEGYGQRPGVNVSIEVRGLALRLAS